MINQFLTILVLLGLITSCNNRLRSYSKKRNTVEAYQQINDTTLMLTGISDNSNYGYSETSPILLGAYKVWDGAENIEKYLNALLGPNGENIKYKRLEPCCPFKTKNFVDEIMPGVIFDGQHGLLERYEIEYGDEFKTDSCILFFNLYDETNQLMAPYGFTFKQN